MSYRFWTLFVLIFSSGTCAFASSVHLRCESLQNPLGIDSPNPRLSWVSDNTEHDWEQQAYEIFVADNYPSLLRGQANIWDSGRVASSESVEIPYTGPALQSLHRYYWKVRVWDKNGRVTESQENSWWEMGFLRSSDWKAQWITWQNPEAISDAAAIRPIWLSSQNLSTSVQEIVPTFRARFRVAGTPRESTLFVASSASYVATINGREVCRKRDWHSFDAQDITAWLTIGENVVEIRLAPPDRHTTDSRTGDPQFLSALIKTTSSTGAISRFATGNEWQGRFDENDDWKPVQILGQSLSGSSDPGSLPEAAVELRRNLDLRQDVKAARLFITCLGSYRFYINGHPVSRDVLTPGLTDYRKRLLYQSYDVTVDLQKGRNTLAVVLGDGWYGSELTWWGIHLFPPPNRLLAQLEVDFADGGHQTFITDPLWKAAASPIRRSRIYSGEVYDARLEQTGWALPSFDDVSWDPVTVAEPPPAIVSAQIGRPPRVIMTLRPKTLRREPNGAYVFDMGQNMVGWVNLKVRGQEGTRVWLRFAEILKKDGSIYTENLRNADATDVYVLRGSQAESFAPHFTFHGFRYVELTGYPGKVSLETLTGEVVSSVGDLPSATLATSSKLINDMWSIGLWGQRGNFLSIPTDCPQRDERLGWMGDAGVFWRTGSYNFDVEPFSEKFMQDIRDAQLSSGAFTNVSPNTLPDENASELQIGAPGWGDTGVILPWTTWVQYRDTEIIVRSWDSMERWMDFIQRQNPDFLRKNGVGPNFSDWLAPDPNTDKTLLATAYWAITASMMEDMAHAIGKTADADRYAKIEEQIRMAFQSMFIHKDGVVGTGTQTSYVVALYAHLAPPPLEPLLVQNLVNALSSRDWHLSTGFLGTPFLLFVLSNHGRDDIAYRLLLNTTYPSWGYMVTKGATTWWERWNGDTGDPSMNSYNHYAFGSVMAWVYRYAAGIDTASTAPGFKRIVIHPRLDPRLTTVRANYNSIYGAIASSWVAKPGHPFQLTVTIPANTSAEIFLPAKYGSFVFQDGKKIAPENRDGAFHVHIGSGSYTFVVR